MSGGTSRWDRYPEYRRIDALMVGDQTSTGCDFGWSTVASSTPCTEHDGCHVLAWHGDREAAHYPAAGTLLSRLPLNRALETTVEIRR